MTYAKMTMIPYRKIPVIINSFNRLHSLRRLVQWLLNAGHSNILILDNASSFPPLQVYLTMLERSSLARVVPLGANLGHRSLWIGDILNLCGIDTEFVYTDPDVVPAPSCSHNVVEILQSILDRSPEINKAGLGLRIDDIPDHYRFKVSMMIWERQFWRTPAACGLFFAPIDTTFALYRPRGSYLLENCIRTGPPDVASHDAWYCDVDRPNAEDVFYTQTARNGNWALGEMKPWLRDAVEAMAREEPSLLHLRFGKASLPGYLEIDGMDDLNNISADSIDGVLGCHGTNGLNVGDLLRGLYRVCKDGAQLLLRQRICSGRSPLAESLETAKYGAWIVDSLIRTKLGPADETEDEVVACLRAAKEPRANVTMKWRPAVTTSNRLITSVSFKKAISAGGYSDTDAFHTAPG